jgi:SAM-dependent methyltransferase
MECAQCHFRFFDSRLTDHEVDRLYSAYRGPAYFAERQRDEPWYSKAVNDGIGQDPDEITTRNSALEEFVRKHADMKTIGKVLDYGGDRGQFIPASLGREKYVFELSDAVPVTGVTRLAAESDIREGWFDLVMACAVLEHCSDPFEVLRKLARFTSPGSLLYIGVPYERYSTRFVGTGPLYARYLDALLSVPFALRLIDLYSTVPRVKWNFVPPFGLVKCSEHLNFFSQDSMAAILKRTGFELLACEVKLITSYPARIKTLRALARRT